MKARENEKRSYIFFWSLRSVYASILSLRIEKGINNVMEGSPKKLGNGCYRTPKTQSPLKMKEKFYLERNKVFKINTSNLQKKK